MPRPVFYLRMKGTPRAARDAADVSLSVGDGFEPTKHDRAMMERALGLAKKAAAFGEVPVGAVLYDTASGRVLGEGYNLRERAKDPSAHAEFIAIVKASKKLGDWRLNGCSLAVTLEPCCMCAGAIINARVGRVSYGADDPKAGAVKSLHRLLGDTRLNHRPLVASGVMAEESGSLLREFFKSLRESRVKKKKPGAT